MKNIFIKSTLATIIIVFGIGIFFGWLFSGSNSLDKNMINESAPHNHQKSSLWTCSMHPSIRKYEFGKCPICGMNLVAIEPSEDKTESSVKLSKRAIKLAEVETFIIKKQKAIKEIHLNGEIDFDESRIYTQTSHIKGRIESLFVNFTGEYVHKGEAIASIYSPDLVTAQEELFEALKIKKQHPKLYKASINKLKNWKFTPSQIKKILNNKKPKEKIDILSDLDGVVISKKVNLGDHVSSGSSLFEVADLSKLWVLFDIYESDIPFVKINDTILFNVHSLRKKFKGVVNFIDPLIDAKTRVSKARVIMENPNKELKPGMFVSGQLSSALYEGHAVINIPKTAVLWTGRRSLVYVKDSNKNQFFPREVSIGADLGDRYSILSGLERDEEIVVHGTFSVDAASQLSGNRSMMNPK